MKKAYSLLCFLSILFCHTWAQNDDNPLKTKSVSVFKNGTGFFIKDGKVKTKDGAYIMSENLPRALFGTFWVHSPAQQLRSISSYQDYVTKKSEVVANSPIALLQANKGKRVKLYIREGKDEAKEYDGVVEEVMIKDEKGEEKSLIDNQLIIFKTGGKWLSIRPSEIWRVEFMEKPNQVLERETNSRQNVLRVDFTNKNSEQPLEMMYLQNGINWTPVYLMTLKDETSAKLELRAEVANNAEDIEGADMSFVVGIPNFRYANQLSSLVDFLQIIHPNRDQYSFNNFSNSISTQSLGYASDNVAPGSITTTPTMGGAQGSADEDLYFYQVKDFSLKKGGRGQYPIFTKDIPISHIYECNLRQNSASRGYYRKDFLFTPDNENPVFHSVKISNKSDSPFTTGAVMVVSEKSGEARPISQDMLNYTPTGGHSYIKFTEAVDIKVKQAEKEVDRAEAKKKVPNPNSKTPIYYDLVTVEGKIEVRNYKSKKVNMNVKRAITGELVKSNVKWLKAERVDYSANLNKTTDVCWETEVEAGGTLEIVYRYKVYIRQ